MESETVGTHAKEPNVGTHVWEDEFLDIPVSFYVMKLTDCLFVWIGDSGKLDNLAVAVQSPYDKYPISSPIIGHFVDDKSCSLASKLSKKVGKQVFLSCSLSNNDSNLCIFVTKRLMKEVAENPDKF